MDNDKDLNYLKGYAAGVRDAEVLCWKEVSRRNEQISTTSGLSDRQHERWTAMAIEAALLSNAILSLLRLTKE